MVVLMVPSCSASDRLQDKTKIAHYESQSWILVKVGSEKKAFTKKDNLRNVSLANNTILSTLCTRRVLIRKAHFHFTPINSLQSLFYTRSIQWLCTIERLQG